MNPSKQVKTPVADLLDATAAAKALLQSYSAGDFASSAHTHILSDVDELVDALASKYDSSHVGTTANKLVQLTAAAKLPAVDGSLLTNIAAVDDGNTNDNLSFLPMRNVTATVLGDSDKFIIGSIDGVLFARGSVTGFGNVYRATNDTGTSWELMTSALGGGTPNYINKLGNGEVIIAENRTLWRSSGWATNPLTATWSACKVCSVGTGIQTFGVDVWQNHIILTEYAVPHVSSRYVYYSGDNGTTWTNVLDLDVLYPSRGVSNIHWHSVAIDGYKSGNPRLWACNGDLSKAIRYSDDFGSTWTTLTTSHQPTSMMATQHGLVCGTDAEPDGLYRILRTTNPADMVYEPMCIYKPEGAVGATGLGFMHASARDTDGNVYTTFGGEEQIVDGSFNCPSAIFVTDGIRANIVYTFPAALSPAPGIGVPGFNLGGQVFVSSGPNLFGNVIVKGDKSIRGSIDTNTLSQGNIFQGVAGSRQALAMGTGVVVTGQRTHVIGQSAVATSDDCTVYGQAATTGAASNSVAMGVRASAAFVSSVAVGFDAKVYGSEGVALGKAAEAGINSVAIGVSVDSGKTTVGSVGIGYNTTAEQSAVAIGLSAFAGNNTVAVGVGSSATGDSCVVAGIGASSNVNYGTAIGHDAGVTHANSTALGYGTDSTLIDQTTIGARHLYMTEVTAPGTIPANGIALYAADDAGTTKLYYKTSAGSTEIGSGGGGTPTAITVGNEATDTTCFVAFVTGATGDLGPKTNTGFKLDSATLRLCVGSGTSTDDGTFISSRATTGVGPHGFRDETTHNASADGGGYGAFDAITTVGGSSNYNHMAAFQCRQIYNGSGTVGEMRGVAMAPVHNGSGTITYNKQIGVTSTAGSGPITWEFGIYSDIGTTRATNNHFIYHAGGASSYHKGQLQLTLGATEANHNGETADGGQLVLSGFGLSSSQMQLGYNTTGDYGWLQAAEYGSSYNPIKINPNGGEVEIGTGAKTDNSSTAGQTRFFLYDVDNATMERVTVGAADSGGSGYKLLRIPN